jgi:hypothetical protein
MAVGLGFHAEAGGGFWLLPQDGRDGGSDEVEDLLLAAGGLGENRDSGGGAGEADVRLWPRRMPGVLRG